MPPLREGVSDYDNVCGSEFICVLEFENKEELS